MAGIPGQLTGVTLSGGHLGNGKMAKNCISNETK